MQIRIMQLSVLFPSHVGGFSLGFWNPM